MSVPLVTVLIPASNAVAMLPGCIEAVAAQDIPSSSVEVVVAVPANDEATRTAAEASLAQHLWWSSAVVTGTVGSRPDNLNAALASAHAAVVCRVDTRSRIPRDYLRRCVETLQQRADVVVVGGRQHALPPVPGARGTGIARALNNRWAAGGARYRGSCSGPADTVYLGAFRTADLRTVGGWDERLPVNEDFDLNRRLGRDGVVWFDADLEVGYVPRDTLSAILRQYVSFGSSKVDYWVATGDPPRPRQVASLAVAAALGLTFLGVSVVASPLGGAAVLCFAGATVIGVEWRGATCPPAGVMGHARAAATIACMAVGWVAGVAASLPRGARRSASVRAGASRSERPSHASH